MRRRRPSYRTLAIDQMQGIALIAFDGDLRCTWVGGGALGASRLTPKDIVGRRPSEVMGEPGAVLEAHLAAALSGGSQMLDFSPDGSAVYETAVSPLRDERQHVIGGLLTLRDITAKRVAEAALRETEREVDAVVEHSGDVLTHHDSDGRYTYVSPACQRVFGRSASELIGRDPRDFVHPEDAPGVTEALRQGFAAGGSFQMDYRLRRPDGSDCWVSSLVCPHLDGQGQRVAVGAVRDISARRRDEQEAREATERFEGAFEHAPIGMALVDLDGAWMKVNRAMCSITGYSEQELLAKRFRDITHPDDLERSLAGLQAVRSGQDFESEKRYLRPDGRVVWVAISTSSVHDQEGQPRYFITQTQDITERKRFEERLSELADHDSQTGLWNRRRFQAELERAVWEVRRRGDHAALLIFDIDHLKYINDSFGHRFGDGSIEHVGALLAAHARYGVVARIGGNEFALIVPGLLATDARGLADDLVSRIAATPLDRDGHRFALSVSAGVVVLDARISSADDALVSADLALHEAKTRGRSRAALYSQGTRQDLLSGLSWSDRLSGALANDAFELVTQPIVDLRKREQAMVDVRLWMRGQDGTLIHPERLMQAAARFGDVHAIDRWAISRIAQTASTSPGTKLALRVAADTIVQTDLVEFVGEQFAATSAEPADLVLCIDDALVREIEDAPVARAVLEAIVHIADSLSVATIVEAVGTDQMIAALVELGVRYGQGPRFDSG